MLLIHSLIYNGILSLSLISWKVLRLDTFKLRFVLALSLDEQAGGYATARQAVGRSALVLGTIYGNIYVVCTSKPLL